MQSCIYTEELSCVVRTCRRKHSTPSSLPSTFVILCGAMSRYRTVIDTLPVYHSHRMPLRSLSSMASRASCLLMRPDGARSFMIAAAEVPMLLLYFTLCDTAAAYSHRRHRATQQPRIVARCSAIAGRGPTPTPSMRAVGHLATAATARGINCLVSASILQHERRVQVWGWLSPRCMRVRQYAGR